MSLDTCSASPPYPYPHSTVDFNLFYHITIFNIYIYIYWGTIGAYNGYVALKSGTMTLQCNRICYREPPD